MTRRRRRLSIAALAVTSLPVFALAAAPSASPSAVPVETLPVLVGKELSEAATRAPADSDWASARFVRPHRGAPGPCIYRSVREWLEIRCNGLVGAGLVAGDPKGVVVRATGSIEGERSTAAVRVVVPIRRGEAKVLGFLEEREEYNGSSAGQAGTLSILWRPGRPDPVLVASGFVPDERPPHER